MVTEGDASVIPVMGGWLAADLIQVSCVFCAGDVLSPGRQVRARAGARAGSGGEPGPRHHNHKYRSHSWILALQEKSPSLPADHTGSVAPSPKNSGAAAAGLSWWPAVRPGSMTPSGPSRARAGRP